MSFNTGFFIQQSIPIQQYSMLFDGVNESINCYNNAVYNFAHTSTFSGSAWVKAVNYSLVNTTIFGKRVSNQGYLFQFNSSNLQLTLTNAVGNRIIVQSTGFTFVNGEWYDVAFTYSGNSLASGVKLYVNGVAVSMTIIENTLSATIANAGSLTIGQVLGGFWNGNMGHVNIWNIELTVQNILDDYNGGTMRNSNLIESANLVLGWKSGQSAGNSGANWYFQDDSGTNTSPSIISTNMEYADRTTTIP